ncbi:uncharacterized protein HaLaN_06073, partial [Haematococcus lacustris]
MAYGQLESVHDPSMGWGGGGLYFHTFTTNVGCMWVKANARSFKLMAQVSDHLSQQQGWDQQIFNEYLMRPSHGDFQNAYAHLRVMDYTLFMNSKIFFRSRRKEYIPGATSKAPTPVMVHFNYHPDKHKRMLCIMDSCHRPTMPKAAKEPKEAKEVKPKKEKTPKEPKVKKAPAEKKPRKEKASGLLRGAYNKHYTSIG